MCASDCLSAVAIAIPCDAQTQGVCSCSLCLCSVQWGSCWDEREQCEWDPVLLTKATSQTARI